MHIPLKKIVSSRIMMLSVMWEVRQMKWISCQRAVLGGKEERTILRGEKVEHYFACKIMNKAYICEAPTDDGPPNDYIETTVLELLCKDCPYKDAGRSLE